MTIHFFLQTTVLYLFPFARGVSTGTVSVLQAEADFLEPAPPVTRFLCFHLPTQQEKWAYSKWRKGFRGTRISMILSFLTSQS